MYALEYYEDFGDDYDMTSEEEVDIDKDKDEELIDEFIINTFGPKQPDDSSVDGFDLAEFIAFDPKHIDETFKAVTDGINQITRLVFIYCNCYLITSFAIVALYSNSCTPDLMDMEKVSLAAERLGKTLAEATDVELLKQYLDMDKLTITYHGLTIPGEEAFQWLAGILTEEAVKASNTIKQACVEQNP